MVIMREAEQEEGYATAARLAAKIWDDAEPALETHRYLNDKVIDTYGLRQIGDRLIVPVTLNGALASLQFIDESHISVTDPNAVGNLLAPVPWWESFNVRLTGDYASRTRSTAC